MSNATHTPDLFSLIYDEIADAIDLLDNVTAAEGSEDDLGLAELALVRAREIMVASPNPRLIAEAPAMLEALRDTVDLLSGLEAHLCLGERRRLIAARATLDRIDGEA